MPEESWLDERLSHGDDAGVARDPEEETPLEGGGLTEVVRVGQTVRRTAGSWAPGRLSADTNARACSPVDADWPRLQA